MLETPSISIRTTRWSKAAHARTHTHAHTTKSNIRRGGSCTCIVDVGSGDVERRQSGVARRQRRRERVAEDAPRGVRRAGRVVLRHRLRSCPRRRRACAERGRDAGRVRSAGHARVGVGGAQARGGEGGAGGGGGEQVAETQQRVAPGVAAVLLRNLHLKCNSTRDVELVFLSHKVAEARCITPASMCVRRPVSKARYTILGQIRTGRSEFAECGVFNALAFLFLSSSFLRLNVRKKSSIARSILHTLVQTRRLPRLVQVATRRGPAAVPPCRSSAHRACQSGCDTIPSPPHRSHLNRCSKQVPPHVVSSCSASRDAGALRPNMAAPRALLSGTARCALLRPW